MGTILYDNMQWWTMAEFDVASNFSKKQRHIVKRPKVSGNAREIDVLFLKKNHDNIFIIIYFPFSTAYLG